MAVNTGYTDGYDQDGKPRRARPSELQVDTVHPQVDDPQPSYVGSATLKNLDPKTGELSNTPNNFQQVVPAGAKVVNGVVHIGNSNPRT